MNRTFKKNLHIEIAYIKYIYAGFEFIFYTQEKFAQSKYIPSPALRGFWWYMISVSGPFGQPSQYRKKSWGPIMSNFSGRFFHVFGVKKNIFF